MTRPPRYTTLPGPMGGDYLRVLPKTLPADRVLVHNLPAGGPATARWPTRRLGSRGFRAWLQAPTAALEVCDCHWAPEFAVHYRVTAARVMREG